MYIILVKKIDIPTERFNSPEIQYSLSISNNCGNIEMEAKHEIILCTEPPHLNISPNPANSIVKVEIDNLPFDLWQAGLKLNLMEITGKIILSNPISYYTYENKRG